MAKQYAGDTVKAGFYWRTAQWQIVTIAEDGETLPGHAGDNYYRVPALLLLGLAPIMGALFVMFLPFIGIAIVLQHALRAAARALRPVPAGLEPLPQERER
ncbi:MAG: hypothetical protein NDJ94_21250 [Vicinamibacteria bacterium]|nr:hypothetical protein [Vicinamibacteria bacterium]